MHGSRLVLFVLLLLLFILTLVITAMTFGTPRYKDPWRSASCRVQQFPYIENSLYHPGVTSVPNEYSAVIPRHVVENFQDPDRTHFHGVVSSRRQMQLSAPAQNGMNFLYEGYKPPSLTNPYMQPSYEAEQQRIRSRFMNLEGGRGRRVPYPRVGGNSLQTDMNFYNMTHKPMDDPFWAMVRPPTQPHHGVDPMTIHLPTSAPLPYESSWALRNYMQTF